MKERINLLVTAAKILQQLPCVDIQQRGIKNRHLETLFRDIATLMFDMEFENAPRLPSMYLSTFDYANRGRKRSFRCNLGGDGGDGGFEVEISVITNEVCIEVIVKSNLHSNPEESPK